MRRSALSPLALVLLLAGCVPTVQDPRVTVAPAAGQAGAYVFSSTVTGFDLRVNSSQPITGWAPKESCRRVSTAVGGDDKAVRCSLLPVVIYTAAPPGQLDYALLAHQP